MRRVQVALLICLSAGIVSLGGQARASDALSARGPEQTPGAVALGAGVMRLRDGRVNDTTAPYLEFIGLRSIAPPFDLELRVTTTGATFSEGGGRLRFGSDVFSMATRFGILLGAASSGPLFGAYGGVMASGGSATFQANLGLDLLWIHDDHASLDDRSSLELRPFVGAHFAVSGATYLYVRFLYYSRYKTPFLEVGAPALVVGVTW